MLENNSRPLLTKLSDVILAVPIRIKIIGLMVLPVLIMGLALNYWVRTGLSDWLSYLIGDERVRVAMQAGSRSVVFVSFLAAAGSILFTLMLMYVLTHPILELRKTARAVEKGNLKSRARVWANDEIGDVAQSVNAMIDHLVSNNEDLARTNRRLEALNRVAMAANLELEIHDVLYLVLKNTLEVLGLKMGWVYLLDPESDQYHLASWHEIPGDMQVALLHTPPDPLCSCQRELLDGTLEEDAIIRSCGRLTASGDQQIHTKHATLKLEAREHKFGIVNLLCDDLCAPSEDDLELLTLLGVQISEIVANAWLLLKLSEKEVARQALLKALVKAQEDERSLLARELHDGAGQNLTSLLVRLKTLEKQIPEENDLGMISDLCDNVSETIEYIRRLSYQLRPIVLEEFGLEIALQTLIEDMAENAGLETEYHCNLKDQQLSYEAETTLYRIAQESITNVVRHAQAKHLKVELLLMPTAISLEIEDDGQGFDADSEEYADGRQRLGLLSMQERLEVLGGSLDVYSAPKEGTSVRARVPRFED